MQKRTRRFDQLERLRVTKRDGLQAELRSANVVASELAMRFAAIQREIAELRRTGQGASAGGRLCLDHLSEHHGYLEQLRNQLAAVRQQQVQLAAELEASRANLLDASNDVKILEKLHAQQLLEHRQRQARSEMRDADDLTRHRC